MLLLLLFWAILIWQPVRLIQATSAFTIWLTERSDWFIWSAEVITVRTSQCTSANDPTNPVHIWILFFPI